MRFPFQRKDALSRYIRLLKKPHKTSHNAANKYKLKVNNKNFKKGVKYVQKKLTVKSPELGQWRRSSVFIVTFEQNSKLFLVFLLFIRAGKCLLGRYS